MWIAKKVFVIPNKDFVICVVLLIMTDRTFDYCSHSGKTYYTCGVVVKTGEGIASAIDFISYPARFVMCIPSKISHKILESYPFDTLLARSTMMPADILCFAVNGFTSSDTSFGANYTRLVIRLGWIAGTCDIRRDDCKEQFFAALEDNQLF